MIDNRRASAKDTVMQARRTRSWALGLAVVAGLPASALTACGHHHPTTSAIRKAPPASSTTATTTPPAAPRNVAGAPPTTCASPPAPIGNDAINHLGDLSLLDLTSRALGQTTADPSGSNNDTVNPIATLPSGGDSMLSATGPGVLTTVRNQHQTGGPYLLGVDGNVESLQARLFGQAGQTGLSDYPISVNVAESAGSSVLQAGIGFTNSISWASSSHEGYFYSMYDRLPAGTAVPNNRSGALDQAAGALRAGAASQLPGGMRARTGADITVPAGATTPLVTLGPGRGGVPLQVRHLRFTVPVSEIATLGDTRLQITWDGAPTPAVDAPLKYLAGDGAGVDVPASGDRAVSTYLTSITTSGSTAGFDLYWPMPFQSSARIVLAKPPASLSGVGWLTETEEFNHPTCAWAPFHATDTAMANPTPGVDNTFLNVGGAGKIVGTVENFHDIPGDPMNWQSTTDDYALEGDVHITTDGAGGPQVNSTGSEEWAFGGSYFNLGTPTQTPLAGMPTPRTAPLGGEVDGAAEYRWLIPDAVPFTSAAKLTWEHGGVDEIALPFQATVLWYGKTVPDGGVSDTLLPGQRASAAAHRFGGRTTTTPLTSGWWYTVTSPAATLPLASGPAPTTFTMAVAPGATGAYLRRTLDTSVYDQGARVTIDGTGVGTWYRPGGWTGSDASGLPRRWLDDDLPLPPSLIAGRTSITVTIVPTPGTTWTAARYELHCTQPLPLLPPR